MKRIAVIDYGAGNLRSVTKALEHIAEAGEAEISLCTSPEKLGNATHIILPGVGAFADCMRGLQNLSGMIAALETQVLEKKTPFLGICVGMQMLLEEGHEHGRHSGLGWFKGRVLPLEPEDHNLKVPHMGWNELCFAGANATPDPTVSSPHTYSGNFHRLFANIPDHAHAYFVHSYHCAMQHEKDIIATTDYGGTVTAAIARENIHGVQFHPEKSQETGLRLFRNFIQLRHAT